MKLLQRSRALADQRGDHAGEYVAGSGGCHAGVAGGVAVVLFAIANKGTVAFEHDNRLGFFGELVGALFKFVTGSDLLADQSAEFAGMRCEDSLAFVF